MGARSRELSEVLARYEPGAGTLAPGDLVADLYRIEERLGAGGMGVVYGVRRVTDERSLALKVMGERTSRGDAVRFAREAEIGAGLDHENLVSVLDVGVHEGLAYLVMERVEGGSLEDARERFGDVEWALPLLAQIARGLAVLHARGVVHRDLKPANVLLSRRAGRDVAKITDFGIAKLDLVDALGPTLTPGAAATAHARTQKGALLGTLAYMAPELASGTARHGPPADVFALGLVAYELLAGAHAFHTPPVLEALAGRPVPSPAELPDRVPLPLRALVRSALSAEPGERPTAEAIAAGVCPHLRPADEPPPPPRPVDDVLPPGVR